MSREVIEGLQEQVREMHDLIERLQAGAAADRYVARIELAIEPTHLPDGRMYFIAPRGFQKTNPDWHRRMFLKPYSKSFREKGGLSVVGIEGEQTDEKEE
jgi:hypothetical protein